MPSRAPLPLPTLRPSSVCTAAPLSVQPPSVWGPPSVCTRAGTQALTTRVLGDHEQAHRPTTEWLARQIRKLGQGFTQVSRGSPACSLLLIPGPVDRRLATLMPEGPPKRERGARGRRSAFARGLGGRGEGGVEGLGAHGVSGEPPAGVACGGDVEEGAGDARLAAPRSCPLGSPKRPNWTSGGGRLSHSGGHYFVINDSSFCIKKS